MEPTMKQLLCATYEGIEAQPVTVESTLTKGLPSFNIVGMANTAITESKERVKSALLSNDFTFPPKRITINLSPSDLKKEGSQFDLGIALLIALNHTECEMDEWYVFGELGLNGSVKENALLYALILSLVNNAGLTRAVVPKESLEKLSNIPGVSFYGVGHLNDAIALFQKKEEHEVEVSQERPIPFPQQSLGEQSYYYQQAYPMDFSNIRGQEIAKRAALIAAAGMHNILLEGSPGCGKSMIAKRLQYILPPVTKNELLDIAKLQSLEGKTPHFSPERPFRSPHHSSTLASVFGGGTHRAQIGEVGLAHHGILFFDELPHYSKQVLEALREPLEDQKIQISRVHSKVEYPTKFLFVAAMNPCPCGNLLNTALACRCSDREVANYKNRLSDPFLDRIDLYVQMQPIAAEDAPSVTSSSLHENVLKAHKVQKERGQRELNGRMDDSEVEHYCNLDEEARKVLTQAVTRFALSFRSIKKVQKVARTIADLEGSTTIARSHLLEALSYRRR
jgi:magnesium chelatase family protein